MTYKVQIDRQAAKALTGLPKKVQCQLGQRIEDLQADPFPAGCEPIKGTKAVYRIVSGSYRIGYKVEKKRVKILILRIGHRKDFYRYFDR